MGFVMFDTHLDTAPEIDGEPLSHCCPAHRVLDLPNVEGRNMAIVGAHGAANPKLEKDVADEHGISVFTIRDIDRMGIEEVPGRRWKSPAMEPRAFTSRWTSTSSTAALRGARAGRRSEA